MFWIVFVVCSFDESQWKKRKKHSSFVNIIYSVTLQSCDFVKVKRKHLLIQAKHITGLWAAAVYRPQRNRLVFNGIRVFSVDLRIRGRFHQSTSRRDPGLISPSWAQGVGVESVCSTTIHVTLSQNYHRSPSRLLSKPFFWDRCSEGRPASKHRPKLS